MSSHCDRINLDLRRRQAWGVRRERQKRSRRKGWWEIGKRTAKKFAENELMSEAASVTFFALLSLFPAITAIVSIYGLFNDPSTIQSHLNAAAGFVPSGGMQIVEEQVKRLTQTPPGGLERGSDSWGLGGALERKPRL